jgi:glycosyltransferase involved in cell wall biosynthesis
MKPDFRAGSAHCFDLLCSFNARLIVVTKTQQPRISVVIPCFNGEKYIRETIRSVLQQSLAPIEILVIDDGSKDRSAAFAASFGPPVRVLRQSNRGQAAARNVGIRAAEGDWIAFLDADDLWHPTKLERQATALLEAPANAVCVFTDLSYFWEDGREELRRADVSDLEGDFHVKMLCRWILMPSVAMVRSDVAREIQFPEGVRNVEDQQFFLLLRRRGRFVHVPEPLTKYRRWSGQMTSSHVHTVIAVRAHLAFLAAHEEWYTTEELAQLRATFADQVIDAHEAAYWKRDTVVARKCRSLYRELCPCASALPRLFDRPLYPRWLLRLKDVLDRAWPRQRGGLGRSSAG